MVGIFSSCWVCAGSHSFILCSHFGLRGSSFLPSFSMDCFVGLYVYCSLRAMGGPCCVLGAQEFEPRGWICVFGCVFCVLGLFGELLE